MTRVCLGDVAREIKQKAPAGQELPTVGLEHLDPGEVELVRWDEDAETTFTKAFSKGQVLFGRRRAYLRKAAVAPFDGVCSGDITVIAAKSNLSPRLLPFIIQNGALFEHAVTNSAGSLSPRVKWQSLSQFEFELPSICKQEELADILWAEQETRSHYRQLLTTCDDIVKSQFVEMFGDLRSNSKNLPIKELDEIASSRLGKMLDSKNQTGKHKKRYLTNKNVQWFRFDLSELNSMDFTPDDQIEFSLQRGDLLVCEGGEVGRCAIWQEEITDCYFQKALHRVRCNDSVIPEYLAWWFKIMSNEGLLIKHTNTSTIAHLSGAKLKKLRVNIPPLSQQKRFANLAFEVDKSKFAVQKALDELNATTKKILNQELGLGDV